MNRTSRTRPERTATGVPPEERREVCRIFRGSVGAAAVLCFLLFFCVPSVKAQEIPGLPEDSLQVERLIERYGPGEFVSNARRALLLMLREGEPSAVSSFLRFMARRQGGAGWLSPEEELLVRTLILDLPFFRNREVLVPLLAARVDRPGGRRGDDARSEAPLVEVLRDMLRRRSDPLNRRVKDVAADEAEEAFFGVLINAQHIRSVRRIADANSDVDRFAALWPASPYAPIADRYLRIARLPSTFGAGFFLGYSYGGMVGSGGGIPGRSDGPTMGGEFYWNRWTATGELMLGRLALSDSFVVHGRTWRSGTAVLVGGMAGVGYEFRNGDGLITPFAGATFFDLQEDAGEENRQDEQSTGVRAGFALGTLLTYRVPFDKGPHLDLRLRISAIFPGFGGYSSELRGGLLLVGASFGFVGRPFGVEPARVGERETME